MAKRLIRFFGFQVHDAPGEAEAECALLQRSGIVDAVLSEDVDTIMFGCTRTLRNWSSEGTKGSKTPTHVSMYDTDELLKAGTGLDREGMVLVALMSGGDYLPEGIPGAGVKLACEAARAGFGKTLCRLKKADVSGLATWKEWLTYELRHNESGFFRTRHKALSVPDSFPNLDVLRYYTHPVVSPESTLDRLRNQSWDKPVDVRGLREFVRETFDWNYRIGAVKYIRVLAPCLLVRKMMSRNIRVNQLTQPLEVMEKEESELVKSITSKRAHFSTDATPELRISFVPTKIVGYDFQEEPDEVIEFGRDGLALNSDDEFDALAEEEGSEAVAKGTNRKPFSPTEPDLFWMPETIAKMGIPIMVEDWEETQRAKATRQKTKAPRKKGKVGGMATGALDKFVKVTKNTQKDKDVTSAPPSPTRAASPFGISVAPSLPPIQASQKARSTRSSKHSTSKSKPRNASPAPRPVANANPWTIAGSHDNTRVTKAGAGATTKATETIEISSSPIASPTKAIYSPVGDTEGRQVENSTPPSSPRKRPSITPTRSSQEGNEASARRRAVVRTLSPSPKSSEKKPRRKLARTESLPMEQHLQNSPTGRSSARQFARARTVAVEAPIIDSEDDDLPPLSSLVGSRSRKGNSSDRPDMPPPDKFLESRPQRQKLEKKQSTLDSVFGATKRVTKVYMPRKSEPGFFREFEVEVDEVDDALGEREKDAINTTRGSRGTTAAAAWRRSDISCIDLTGED